MCFYKCSECLRGTLSSLIVIGILLNVLLLFPSMTVVKFEDLSEEVKYFPGIIGCGLLIVFPIFRYMRKRRGTVEDCCHCELYGPKCSMCHYLIFGLIGIAGASYGILVAWIAIRRGPKCDTGEFEWTYPFHDWSYLTLDMEWDICVYPPAIVAWNFSLFFVQMGVNFFQLTLCVILLINNILAMLCDACYA